jgi:hypothetical protein
MRKIIGLALAAALAGTLPLLAETAPNSTQQGVMMQNGMMQGGMMRGMMGMHVMPVTVTAIDTQTGLVDGTSGGMALKLHFPPASLAGVKAGDKLSVHLGFSKP